MEQRTVWQQIKRGIFFGTFFSTIIFPPVYFKLIHPKHPTGIARAYYNLTDIFSGSYLERMVEEDFDIDYEGNLSDENLLKVYSDLLFIRTKNSDLFENLKKVVIISESVAQSELVYPYLTYVGIAETNGSIELIEGFDISSLAHELAHIRFFNTSKKYQKKFESFFNWKEAKLDRSTGLTMWADGSYKPKNGFLEPYGAKNVHECLATYVEKFFETSYSPSFWSTLDKDFDYEQVLEHLLDGKFITEKQFYEAVEELRKR